MARWTPLLLLALAAGGCSTDTGATTTTVATTPPTTTSVATATSTAPLAATTIGTSIEGRPIDAWSFGSGDRRLYIVGGIHGDERSAVENVPALIEYLGGENLAGWTVRIVLDANPDGTAANTRANSAGVDLNRNWPAGDFVSSPTTGASPLSEPETAALAEDIAAFAPDLIVALHAAREGPFVEYDGAGEDPAHAFALGASAMGREWQVLTEVDWATDGSLGTYFGTEGRVPVVTVEFNRWDSPAGVTDELLAGLAGLLGGAPTGTAESCDDHRVGMTCTEVAAVAHDLLHEGTTGGAHGFIIKEVDGAVHAALHADAGFYPASTIKLVHFAHSLRWIAAGNDAAVPVTVYDDGCAASGPDYEEQLDMLLEAMMKVSDNSAANAIQAHFGLEDLRATIADAGMNATRLAHGFGCGGPANSPANVTTAVDLAVLVESMINGSLLPREQRPLIESLMVDATGAAGFDSALGIEIFVKEGWYGTTLTVAGFAIVPNQGGERLFVFAAYTHGAAAVDESFSIVAVPAILLSGIISQ
jgi:murein peptide amidase A